ncbi:MAG: hypothetical protein JW838_06690 [Spirochaetes bacterium]|nr:hypothetical protein [Spirochaetota bacterium]
MIDPGSDAVVTADGAVIRCEEFRRGGGREAFTTRALKGLPDYEEIEILDAFPLHRGERLLVLTRFHGVHEITPKGESRRIDTGIPPEVVYPFKQTHRTKPVRSHAISRDGTRMAVVIPSALYLSADGGRTFRRLPLAGVKRSTELLSVALHPRDERLIIIGTASNGVYYSMDGGATARLIKRGAPGEPARSPNFLEEVRSLAFGDDGDTFFVGFGNGHGVYRGSLSRKTLEAMASALPVTYPDGDPYRVTAMGYHGGSLFVVTNRNRRTIVPVTRKAPAAIDPSLKEAFLEGEGLIALRSGGVHLSFPPEYRPRRDFEPDRRALGKRALYISYSFTQKENYPKLMKLLRHLDFNAVVINLKDDYGTIRVPVSDPLITRVPGSVNPYVNVLATIRRLKKEGIYVIARQVCFQDEKLYAYRNGAYAVKNLAGAPYRKGPEKWVDAFSEFVWDYNIAAAREFEKAGVDEIQFDYIRFPDIRGERDGRRFDHRRGHQTMREALASFLKKARERIEVPISVDLFGFNAIYQWGEWIGQDVSDLSRYVDVISPMFYPSHYTGGYAASYGDRRIYYTIYLSCKRAMELAHGVHLRPYIQAFYYKENQDNYGVDYIGWELDGLKRAGCEDYIFWNDLSEYTILIRGLRKYRGVDGGGLPPDIRSSIPRKLPFSDMVER